MEIIREYEYLLNLLLSAIIIISFSFIKTIFIKTYSIKINEPIRKMVNILIIVIGIIILVTATGFQFLSRSLEDSKHIIFASIMCLASYIGIGGLGLFFAYTNKLNGELEKQVETEQHFNIMREKYYQTLLEKETDTKMYRHDLINHLICLSEIANEENIDKIQDYIHNLQKNIVNIQNKAFFTGCNVLDIFINYYAQVLEANITIDVKGKCTCGLAISDVDMCVIFSNLLQNAVEHLNQQKREGKYLKINIKEGDVFFQVQIINSLNNGIGSTKELVTTKNDKYNHGYGLQNIKEAINRNDGSFSIEFNDYECIANVVLKISNNQVI
ncbi:MAG: GHKL domain-containing protein [Firmicutes bacterium]|nr:GHKL domain-containing protein [Bacillota bacterium]